MNTFGSRCSNFLFLTALVLCSSMLQLYSICNSYVHLLILTSSCNQESGNCGSGCELQGLTRTFSGRFLAFFSEKNPGPPQAAARSSSHLTGKLTYLIYCLYACDIYLYLYTCVLCHASLFFWAEKVFDRGAVSV